MKRQIITLAAAFLMLAAAIPSTPSGVSQAEIAWSSLPPCPFYISRANCVKVGDYIYVNGGMGGGFGSWWVTSAALNIHTEQWTNMTPMSVELMNMSLVAVHDSIYYALPNMAGNLYKFEPTAGGPQGTWSMVTPLPNPAVSTAAAFDGDQTIYMYVNGLLTNVHECYALDIYTEILTPIADLPTVRFFPGAAFVNGRYYIFGGQDEDLNMMDNVYEYDPGTDTWTTKASMIRPSCYNLFNTVVREDLVYLVGGGEPDTWLPTDSIQVYDPATDQWSIYETLRTNSYGVNVACYVPEYDYIFDCGGVDGAMFYGDAWKGTFASFANVTVDLTYISGSPVPAGGGNLTFDVFVENLETTPVDFDAWLEAAYEGGDPTTLVLRSFTNYQPGWTINRPGTYFPVPAAWPAGNYTFTGKVGINPAIAWDESSFPFVKSGTSDGNAFSPYPVDGAPNPFDRIDQGDDPVAAVTDFDLVQAYPNPFNPATVISFQIPEVSRVSLRVYDMTGRQVAELVDGWRDAGSHEVTFDASHLASGIYVYHLQAGEFTASGKMVLMK